MNYFSVLEPPSKEFVQKFTEKRGFSGRAPESYYNHPQEDYLLTSDSPPVFVVADGVTLNIEKLAEKNLPYPNPSPAGDIAKIFCEAVVRGVENRYEAFGEDEIKEVFREANNEVGKYNKKLGKSEFSGNKTGFCAATGAFVTIKDGVAYWISVRDSYIAHFNKNMVAKFRSPEKRPPYDIINGEEKFVETLHNKGSLPLEESDIVFVFTDGFEHHVKHKRFLSLFREWSPDIKERVSQLSTKMNLEDPKRYGHERSLIVIQT